MASALGTVGGFVIGRIRRFGTTCFAENNLIGFRRRTPGYVELLANER